MAGPAQNRLISRLAQHEIFHHASYHCRLLTPSTPISLRSTPSYLELPSLCYPKSHLYPNKLPASHHQGSQVPGEPALPCDSPTIEASGNIEQISSQRPACQTSSISVPVSEAEGRMSAMKRRKADNKCFNMKGLKAQPTTTTQFQYLALIESQKD